MRRFAVLAAVLAGSGAAARADVLPTKERPAIREIRVDLGPYQDHATRRYVVLKGDTLGEIAERELGTTRRQSELLRLNPDVAPGVLRVGQRLVMPPRDTRGAWWDFFCWSPGDRALAPARVFHRVPIQGLRPGARVYAVPHDVVDGIPNPAAGRGFDGAILEKSPRVARSSEVGTAGRVSCHEVVAVKGRSLALTSVDASAFDHSGRPPPAADDSRTPAVTAVVVLLALVALVGVALLLSHRARRTEPRLRAETGGPAGQPAEPPFRRSIQ